MMIMRGLSLVIMKSFGLILLFVASALAAKNYAGYQVIRVVPDDIEQLEKLYSLYNRWEDAVDFWKEPRSVNHPVDIMIGPHLLEDVKVELALNGLEFSIFHEDVQGSIESVSCSDCAKLSAGFNYNVYHSSDEISHWVTDFANEQPLVTEINIGNSHEGRPIKAVKISSGPGKRVIYIQGGIHAREWISPATVMYMANTLATTYDTDNDVKTMVDNYDWYIVPSLNVDGYSYTWSNDRMWRKNRQPNSGSSCVGTDLNRNYPYQWGGVGASKSPCSETFRGSSSLSGVEVSVVHNWIQQHSGNIALFIDFHNYGQLWLYPWGYTGNRNTPQPDKTAQDNIAKQATAAIQAKYGTSYFVGMSGPDMYPASGASEDYGYGTLDVKYTFVVELRDKGRYGFLIPERMIQDSGIETFEALKVLGTSPLS